MLDIKLDYNVSYGRLQLHLRRGAEGHAALALVIDQEGTLTTNFADDLLPVRVQAPKAACKHVVLA